MEILTEVAGHSHAALYCPQELRIRLTRGESRGRKDPPNWPVKSLRLLILKAKKISHFEAWLSAPEQARKELEDASIVMAHLETKQSNLLREQSEYVAAHEKRLKQAEASKCRRRQANRRPSLRNRHTDRQDVRPAARESTLALT